MYETQPACIRHFYWTETSWGWQTYIKGSLTQFSEQRFRAKYPCIKYRGEWHEIKDFEPIIQEHIKNKEIERKQAIAERVGL